MNKNITIFLNGSDTYNETLLYFIPLLSNQILVLLCVKKMQEPYPTFQKCVYLHGR